MNTFGKLWCRKCDAWKSHGSDGKCRDCGRQLFYESTEEMLAGLAAKGYVQN